MLAPTSHIVRRIVGLSVQFLSRLLMQFG